MSFVSELQTLLKVIGVSIERHETTWQLPTTLTPTHNHVTISLPRHLSFPPPTSDSPSVLTPLFPLPLIVPIHRHHAASTKPTSYRCVRPERVQHTAESISKHSPAVILTVETFASFPFASSLSKRHDQSIAVTLTPGLPYAGNLQQDISSPTASHLEAIFTNLEDKRHTRATPVQ